MRTDFEQCGQQYQHVAAPVISLYSSDVWCVAVSLSCPLVAVRCTDKTVHRPIFTMWGRRSHAINEGAYAAFLVFKLRSSEWTLKIPLNKSWCVERIFRNVSREPLQMMGERDWSDTRSTSFLLLYNSNSQLSSNSWITVRGLLQLNLDNLLLLDLNTTQLYFCSWVKTQHPRNRVACSKIKVFTRSSPQTCSLLIDKFCWLEGEAVQGRRSF